MRVIKTKKGRRVLEIVKSDLSLIEEIKHKKCEECGASEEKLYFPLLNQKLFCQSCLSVWDDTANPLPEDLDFEDSELDKFKPHLSS